MGLNYSKLFTFSFFGMSVRNVLFYYFRKQLEFMAPSKELLTFDKEIRLKNDLEPVVYLVAFVSLPIYF